MRGFLNLANIAIVCAMALALGIRRVTLVPDEVFFFSHVGLGEMIVVLFGALQLGSMAMILVPRTRVVGAWLTAGFFVAGTLMYLLTNQIVVGLVSCAPVLMAGWIAHEAVEVDEE